MATDLTSSSPISAVWPAPKPANRNPWYILMTLHGEQPEWAEQWHFDKKLHAKNRMDWNRWAAQRLTDGQRRQLLEAKDAEGKVRFSAQELTPHDHKEVAALASAFSAACTARGVALDLPSSTATIDVSKTLFERPLIATGLLFHGYTGLSGATFSRGTNLSDSTFSGYADLEGATFSGNAILSGVTFSGTADLSGAKFSKTGVADFTSATFGGHAIFLNAELEGDTHFANTKFLKHPPRLHGAKLNEGVTLDGVQWPDPPPGPTRALLAAAARTKNYISRRKLDTRRDDAQVHVYNYQRLKQIMEGLKKHEDELKFFAMEMRAQRVVDRFEGKRGRAALNWLYEKTCNYGLSVARPSLWLAGSFLVTMLPMAVWLGWDRPAWYFLPKLKSAVGLSLANFLAPLNLRKDFVDADYLLALPAGLKLLGGVQTICGLLFAFLIGLSLRNRFRMK